jgi:hypothetical protein
MALTGLTLSLLMCRRRGSTDAVLRMMTTLLR